MEAVEYTINDVIKMLADNQAKQDEAHLANAAKMATLEGKIDPIYEVYSDLQGTKRVLKWVFGTISLMVGFFVSIGELIHFYKHK